MTRRREVELRLSDRKQKLYADFMAAQLGLFMAVKNKTALKPSDSDTIARFSSNALLIASDQVIREYQEFQRFARDHPEDLKSIRFLATLTLALRRDMGNPRTQLSAQEAMQSFIRVEDWNELSDLFI